MKFFQKTKPEVKNSSTRSSRSDTDTLFAICRNLKAEVSTMGDKLSALRRDVNRIDKSTRVEKSEFVEPQNNGKKGGLTDAKLAAYFGRR